jgi:FO synthase
MLDADLQRYRSARPHSDDAYGLLGRSDWRQLAFIAGELRDAGWGRHITYSRKVFVPLTHLCRDVCHYCTFARSPRLVEKAFLAPDDVLAIARAGAQAGCKEALFTLGDRPEARHPQARAALARLGHESTLSYLGEVAQRVLDATGLLPHLNPGLMGAEDLATLRKVAPSMGIMLETASERLSGPGGPHFGSPDKLPARRLETIRVAGEMRVPLTTGILIGIGETRRERIDALLALRDLADRHGHIQEIIVQNFRAKPGTKMRDAPQPGMDDLCWTIAVARLIFGPDMSIQAPPNLYRGDLAEPIAAGINDWGGVSPVTPDHVNPEAPWPHLDRLAEETERAGHLLVERLTVYPRFVAKRAEWIDPALHRHVLRLSDGGGLARIGQWAAGLAGAADVEDERDVAMRTSRAAEAERAVAMRASPAAEAERAGAMRASPAVAGEMARLVERALAGVRLGESQVAALFAARGPDLARIRQAADELRAATAGDTVTYVVTRNINYTNICLYHCGFCAFSKGKTHADLRGAPYIVDLAEIRRRVREAWERGATEVCMQGGIHPSFTGETYLSICRAAKEAVPDIHVHAFSPLEVAHGARTLGLSIREFLERLKAAGLGSLPGTAAEILDDEVRRVICPDKLSAEGWLAVVAQAHAAGLPTTSTIMFGHLESYTHWARHLLHLRDLQQDTHGFSEFVPLPFVHMEAPLYRKGQARKGPTLREAILMHAGARLVLHPHFRNIQASWVKLGPRWAQECLRSGANDLGGTLMNESISRAAGAAHGQELAPQRMEELIRGAGRMALQRTTLYRPASAERCAQAWCAPPLEETVAAKVAARALTLHAAGGG